MNRNPWFSELRVVLPALLGFCVFGLLIGKFALSLVFFLLFYVGRSVFHLYRLEYWLRSGGSDQGQPEGGGIWEAIYDHFYVIRRRNKSYKKQLGKILKRYRRATAALPDATVVLGPSDEINWFNSAAKDILGLEKQDRGLRIANLVRHPDFVEYLQSRDYQGTVTIAAPGNDDLVLQIRIVSYGGGLRLLIAQDVTRIRQMERMRTDFVANVSHELRTPLTVLRGYLETLQDIDDIPVERMKKSFGQMEQQTKRMQFLIEDLLLLARLESGPKESRKAVVDVVALIKRVCNDARLMLSDETTIKLEIDSDAKLWGVEQELFSAFSNLVVNAIKHTPANTAVTVRWREEEGGVRFDVIDQGEGIDSRHIPRLTERFYRVDANRSRKEGGTGLGLAIVKHVLSRHNGELIIESTLGKGSCFSCRFSARQIVVEVADVINMS